MLKYRGGKRRELPFFQKYISDDYSRYVEPFLGGGAVYFHLEPERALISDISEPLVTFYRQIADSFDSTAAELAELSSMYRQNQEDCERRKAAAPGVRIDNANEQLYIRLRDMYNGRIPAEYSKAALYFFINKTAYSGMIRYNSRGEYNVPFGRYRNFSADCVTAGHSKLLQKAEICCEDFECIFEMTGTGDFVFLDPPYDSAFHRYSSGSDFGENEHRRLASAFRNLSCRALMVISRSPLTSELYAGSIVDEYPVRYAVNIRNRFATDAVHLVVSNFAAPHVQVSGY